MTELAKRYGDSLYDLAVEENLTDRLMEELDALHEIFAAQPDYLRLLSKPSLPKAERCTLLDEALKDQVHPYLLNFIKILCEEGILREFNGCRTQYRTRYNQDKGILEVTAISAVALGEKAQANLSAKLAAMTGKTIRLTAKTDPAVLGGLRIDMGGVQLDGTVKHRLDALRHEIDSAVL